MTDRRVLSAHARALLDDVECTDDAHIARLPVASLEDVSASIGSDVLDEDTAFLEGTL